MDIAIWVFFIVLFLLTIAVGVLYIRGASTSSKATFTEPHQQYVINNIDKFKVVNRGSSLDDKEIYLVDYNDFGY